MASSTEQANNSITSEVATKRIIVIGAGPAGVVAAETLRKADTQADIAIIGAGAAGLMAAIFANA